MQIPLNLVEQLVGCLVLEVCRGCSAPVQETSPAATLCEKCWEHISRICADLNWCQTPPPGPGAASAIKPTLLKRLIRNASALLGTGTGPNSFFSDICHAESPDEPSAVAQPAFRSEPVPVASAVVYEGKVRDLIRMMKYQKDALIASDLSALMPYALDLLKPYIDVEDSVLVPIPLSSWRFAARGFNQADALACELQKLTGIPVRSNLLSRKHSPPQHDLSREARFVNLLGTFRLSLGARIHPRVIIVDDIYTSGATIIEAATVLRRAGVQHVAAITVARAVLG
jgi:ComF family protein